MGSSARLCFLATFAAGSLASSSSAAIIGGTPDSADPSVVAITAGDIPVALCTGTVVAPLIVLTAGHCIRTDTERGVRFGASVDVGSYVPVVAQAAHPKYTRMGAPFDIGVMVLAAPSPAPALPLGNAGLVAAAGVGAPIRHVGFGVNVEGGGGGGTKRQATYPVTQITGDFVYSNGANEQTCTFDSGGPAFLSAPDGGAESLVAVVSDGPNCHVAGWDIRLDRDDIQAWIASQIASPPMPRDASTPGAVESAPPAAPPAKGGGCSVGRLGLRGSPVAWGVLGLLAAASRRRRRY